MTRPEGPALRRRRLGLELKRCREAAGLTQEQVSARFEWHAAKVTRIETARVSVTPRDVKDLLTLYGVDDPDFREGLLELARSSRERSLWAEYRDIVRPDSYISLEAEATRLRDWEPIVVPGLLQTEAYMRALFGASVPLGRPHRVDRAVSLRLARQRRLTGDQRFELVAIIDESVLRRRMGGPDVMAGQLRHLLETAELPGVTLRILPHDAGAHPFLGTSAAILEFGHAPDVVFVEGFGRPQRLAKQPPGAVSYRDLFERLATRCLDQRETLKMIENALSSSPR